MGISAARSRSTGAWKLLRFLGILRVLYWMICFFVQSNKPQFRARLACSLAAITLLQFRVPCASVSPTIQVHTFPPVIGLKTKLKFSQVKFNFSGKEAPSTKQKISNFFTEIKPQIPKHKWQTEIPNIKSSK
jgi:hypothetical protein